MRHGSEPLADTPPVVVALDLDARLLGDRFGEVAHRRDARGRALLSRRRAARGQRLQQ
jgi:hypothetical protein